MTNSIPERVLHGVFFLSGMAALLYQLAWQRLLFMVYGTNSEAVTAIISVFMFGLGIGSLVGGEVSRRFPSRVIRLFVLAEVCIGLFGLASVTILSTVGAWTSGIDAFEAGLVSFGIIAFPTFMMGATLPLLVAYAVSQNHVVGEAVADLYYVNTLGSAFVCILASLLIFRFTGLNGAVYLAAVGNFLVAGITAWFARERTT
jgi:predicted membrane-bound spermidine synthase